MIRDPKQFRERYKRWKQGIQVYESGRPIQVDDVVPQYENGKESYWDMYNKALTMTLDPREQYDYVGYLNKYGSLTPSDTNIGHYTDEFKLPQHPTFSNESIYSTSQRPGGRWFNDGLIYEHSDYTINHSDETIDYLTFADPNTRSVYKGGYLLPSILVKPKKYNPGKDDAVDNTLSIVKDVASFLPIVGTGIDIYDAINGDKDAIAPALIGVAADATGLGLLGKAAKAQKAYKAAIKLGNRLDSYKAMQKANAAIKQASAATATFIADMYSNVLQQTKSDK